MLLVNLLLVMATMMMLIINHDDADHQSSTCVCQSDFEEQFIIQLSSRAARKDLLNLNSTITGVGTGPLHARIDSF